MQRAETRELRLAVVLYGGVSLAIYMHGTTKELHRLVKASALEDGGEEEATQSERFYRELLQHVAERNKGVRTRVVVDVIAGTSAGGINGIYLAKALAENRSQDALRNLWLKHGDIRHLLRGPSWLPAAVKTPWILLRAGRVPPLKGDTISRWMYDALLEMDKTKQSPPGLQTLMPEEHLLELFVTTTDFNGYDRDLVISDPPLIHDHTHRHVLAFRHGEGDTHFAAPQNGALAFAARATSCFPGAFPPVSFELFAGYLAKDGADLTELGSTFFRIYELSHAAPEKTFFVDGGVLDNRPFGHAIRAIKRRRAEAEVDRRLIYLEPDPAAKPGPHPAGEPPGPPATILAAISGIPKKEPILDDILEVARHNERVRRIRDVIEMSFEEIAGNVKNIVGDDLDRLAKSRTPEQLAEWSSEINRLAKEKAGLAHNTYLRSKVDGVVDRYARMVCRLSRYPDDCNQAAFVRSVLREWGKQRLFPETAEGKPGRARDLDAFLATFDLDYGARRIRFVIDGLSWYYREVGKTGFPSRRQINDGKRVLYDMRDLLVRAMEGKNLGVDLTREVLACFAQQPVDDWISEGRGTTAKYAEDNKAELKRIEVELGNALDATLTDFKRKLFDGVLEAVGNWHRDRHKEILVRYLGFPFWDVLLYPIQALSDAAESDAIDIVRMSPLDANLLEEYDPEHPKLAGAGLRHFGAFFKPAGRERDYLWGRLDGAERLIAMLLGDGHSREDLEHWCRKAFAAIAEEEGDVLKKATELLDRARNF